MVDVAKVLRFLQVCKFDLVRDVPGFMDAYIAKDGSAKLVLRVAAPLMDPPIFSFEDEFIPVEVKVDFPDAKPVKKAVVMAGPMMPVQVQSQQQQHGKVGETALPMKNAISPHENEGRNAEAFNAWKNRHKHVKVV
jgi:hypothetical protein